jgi:ABC-type multidrug transport system fused ATPase/permease subunit
MKAILKEEEEKRDRTVDASMGNAAEEKDLEKTALSASSKSYTYSFKDITVEVDIPWCLALPAPLSIFKTHCPTKKPDCDLYARMEFRASLSDRIFFIFGRWMPEFATPGVPGTTKQILLGVSGEVKSGQVFAIIGASGSGKTTLLDRCFFSLRNLRLDRRPQDIPEYPKYANTKNSSFDSYLPNSEHNTD